MGNFSINHYASFRPAGGELRVLYRLDVAELPSVEEMRSLDADGDGNVTAAEKSAYAARKGGEVAKNLSLRVGGRGVPLAVGWSDVQVRPGAAGLPTLLLTLRFTVPLDRAAGPVRVEYADHNYPTRTGWREAVASAGDGWTVAESDVPAKDVSTELLNYPTDLVAAPPQVTTAHLSFVPVAPAGPVAPPAAAAPAAPSGSSAGSRFGPRDRFTELVTAKHLSFGFVLFGLGVAFVLGAVHALGPGHGKTVVAAYLVGSRGTARHALLLGAVVTATHVAGVFLLGFIVLILSRYVVPESLYPWLSFASGMTILVVGASSS